MNTPFLAFSLMKEFQNKVSKFPPCTLKSGDRKIKIQGRDDNISGAHCMQLSLFLRFHLRSFYLVDETLSSLAILFSIWGVSRFLSFSLRDIL